MIGMTEMIGDLTNNQIGIHINIFIIIINLIIRDYHRRDKHRHEEKHKKGRGFARMNANTAMRGWEDEDYMENLKKLKDQATRAN